MIHYQCVATKYIISRLEASTMAVPNPSKINFRLLAVENINQIKIYAYPGHRLSIILCSTFNIFLSVFIAGAIIMRFFKILI